MLTARPLSGPVVPDYGSRRNEVMVPIFVHATRDVDAPPSDSAPPGGAPAEG